jgi:hypothetical protein
MVLGGRVETCVHACHNDGTSPAMLAGYWQLVCVFWRDVAGEAGLAAGWPFLACRSRQAGMRLEMATPPYADKHSLPSAREMAWPISLAAFSLC